MAEPFLQTDRGTAAGNRPLLTERQRQEVRRCQMEIQASPGWHGGLPVLLLDRCWLRLQRLPVDELLLRLPPDGSRDAPELERYRRLRSDGHPDWQAQQLCWEEFGSAACRQALLRFWEAQERGDHGWSLAAYNHLIREYRGVVESGRSAAVPLLVLARADETGRREPHRLHWLAPGADEADRPMRHTCP